MSFYAYNRIAENQVRECFGLDFEDFEPGQCFRHRPGVTLSQQDNVDESLDSMNPAMIHYDAQYSAQTAWGKELMVSTVTLQRLIGMSSKTFGRKHSLIGFKEIAMTKPVFGGDTLYAESEIIAVDEGDDPNLGDVTVVCHGVNQNSETIAQITYRVRIWRRGRHSEDRHENTAAAPAEEDRYLAHRAEPDGSLTEQVGLFYEDSKTGDTYVHWPRRTMLRDEAIENA